MSRYLLRRLVVLVPVLFLVGCIAFILVRLTPGDPASIAAGSDATPQQVALIREQMGLNRPLPVQFVDWMKQVFLKGQLGNSLAFDEPVRTLIAQRAQPTLMLALFGGIFSLLLGLPLGMLAAVRHNTWLDRALMAVAIFGLSVPNFWLGLLLVMAFSIHWTIFPPAGYVSLQQGGFSALRYVVLPAVAIGVSNAAFLARMVRSSMLDVLREDYIRTARAKGLRSRAVILKHALKPAMIPPLTVIGMLAANLISGTIIVEIVFSVPGAGRLLINAVTSRDYPVLQGIIIVTALIYILANLIVDILYGVLDPRVRYE